jgi:glycosyltransferase involved in cell wall biosynthesis
MMRADILTFPSNAAFKLMKRDHPLFGFEQKDVRIVPNGIDVAAIQKQCTAFRKESTPLFPGKIKILNVSQHVHQKRFDRLLRALAPLKEKFDFVLLNIGDGALLDKHRVLAASLGLEERTRFLGKLNNDQVIQYMSRCDLFVMPSVDIVFDLVTLEAMATGLPVIVTGEGGNLELIRDGEDGFLTIRDDIGNIKHAIESAIVEKERSTSIARAGLEKIQHYYTTSRMCEDYKKIYRDLLFLR